MQRLLPLLAHSAWLAVLATAALAQPHPLARVPQPPDTLVNGRWNGVDLERRSACMRPENEGTRGTYAQFDISTDATGAFAIGQSGITGLNCNYVGRYQVVANRLSAEGTYSCTDGKQGAFRTTSVVVRPTALEIRMAIQLTGTETCAIDAILGMARFEQ
jgi:hypothetical protein